MRQCLCFRGVAYYRRFVKNKSSILRRLPWEVFYSLSVLVLAPALSRWMLGMANFSGLLSDLAVAFLFLYPVVCLKRAFRFPFLLIWFLTHAASYELLKSMDRLPSLFDLGYLLDPDFIANSGFSFDLSDWAYRIFFGLSVMTLMLVRGVELKSLTQRARWLLVCTVLTASSFLVHSLFLTNKPGVSVYRQYNPVHWLMFQPFVEPSKSTIHASDEILLQDLSGPSAVRRGKAKNVLIIALEGLTGSYIKQSQEYFKLPVGAMHMKELSRVAEGGMIIPDFVAHSHQTIRGLYSLLCGDISKLSWSTPKAIQLQSLPDKAANCLPHQLAQKGFQTHYLQGAGMVFMGKDRFMPLIGFQESHGLEWFGNDVPANHWGVDDQIFFKGALDYVETLRKKKTPWFLTLLTVGTHQPYEVSEEFAAAYGGDKKKASVAFLDLQIANFLDELKKRGVFKDTLIIVTADESHGSELGDWASSWVPAIVFAPEQKKLPSINPGPYGLYDTTLSVLDYLGKVPTTIPGRSFFRKYLKPRDLVSFTADRLRWLSGDGKRIECNNQGQCRSCGSSSILGLAECENTIRSDSAEWVSKARWLDENLSRLTKRQIMHFANGTKLRQLLPWQDQWANNLIGAQYLDFPAGTQTEVRFKWKVLKTTAPGLRLRLILKQAEKNLPMLQDELPALKQNEVGELVFVFDNPKARSSFSFHLLPESSGDLEIIDFTIIVKEKT